MILILILLIFRFLMVMSLGVPLMVYNFPFLNGDVPRRPSYGV